MQLGRSCGLSNSFIHYTSKHLEGMRYIKQGVTSQIFEEFQLSRVGTCLRGLTILVADYYSREFLHMFIMPSAAMIGTYQLDRLAKLVYETTTQYYIANYY